MVDIAARKKKPKTVDLEIDGEKFSIVLTPMAYSWEESLAWAEKARRMGVVEGATNLTSEQMAVTVDFAKGMISGFDGLTNNGQPATIEDLGQADPELFGLILTTVMESVTSPKASEKDSNSGSTPEVSVESAQTSTP